MTKALTQAELQAKHGTPAEFRRAVRAAIGEISIAEAEAAIAAYSAEWANATTDLVSNPPFACDPED